MSQRLDFVSSSAGALAGRLLTVGGVFGLAVLTELHGRTPFSERELAGLYALVLVGFMQALALGLVAARGRRGWSRFVELAGDGLLVSGLVYCTGGFESPFSVLYVVWIVYAALSSGREGAVGAWGVSTIGYAAIVWGESLGFFPAFDRSHGAPFERAATMVFWHTSAFAAVAVLAHRLATQIHAGRVRLEELGELHRRIVDNVSSGLLTVGRSGEITSFNTEAERITGFRRSEVVGLSLRRLFPGLDLEVRMGGGAEVPAECDEPLSRLRVGFENRRGEHLHLGLSISVLRDSRGDPDGRIVIFQDLTRVVEMEDRLRRSERLGAVGQLAAGLAHELRNPLASLSGAVELIAADLPEENDTHRRLGEIVRRETSRLSRLVGDFLEYAKPGQGGAEVVDLDGVVTEVRDLFRVGEGPAVVLDVQCASRLRVQGNADQLRQVLWNLLLNAAQAGSRDGVVRLRAGRVDLDPGSWVDVRVSDAGCGISPEVLERIFEPFYTTKPKGTGLGLAMVHRIIEAHGGQISVRSDPGIGTEVRILLPAAS